jgi:hypothetical protein
MRSDCKKIHSNILCKGRYSSVGIAIDYGLDGPRIESRWERDFSHTSRLALGAHPASSIMGTGSFLGVKRPGHDANHLVKKWVDLYLYSPSGSFGVCYMVLFKNVLYKHIVYNKKLIVINYRWTPTKVNTLVKIFSNVITDALQVISCTVSNFTRSLMEVQCAIWPFYGIHADIKLRL